MNDKKKLNKLLKNTIKVSQNSLKKLQLKNSSLWWVTSHKKRIVDSESLLEWKI